MTTVENLPSPKTERPIGFGRLKRKEDARFIRGKGRYLDDIRLPGMVHGAMLRSPYAHARIVSIDTSRALAHPNVAAVITAKDLETLGLAWMPTISYDTQAVLAGDKVRFQGQEVAFVIATDEYSANDALELIDVEYEPLPAIVNARKALDPDAPLIRDDKAGQRDNLASPIWEAGDEEATDRAFAEADTIVARDIIYPRCHPAPLETCGMIADFNPETGQLDIYNGNQAPHAHRTVYAHVAGLAEHMIRIKCSDIGGGFGNKVPVYPGYVCAIAGSIVAGVPVKWVENRTENLVSTGFARDYVMHARDVLEGRQDHRPARRRDRRPRRLRLHRAADEVPGRVLPHRLRVVRPPGVARQGQGRLHEQGAGRRRVPLLVPHHRGRLPRGAHGRRARARDEGRPDRAADEQLHRARAVPVRDDDRLDVRLRELRRDDARGDGHRRLRGSPPRAGGEARPRRADGHRRVLLHRGRRRRAAQAHGHPRPGDERRRRPAGAPVGQGGRQHQRQTQGQGHETTFAQIVAEELGIPPEDVEVRHGDTDRSPYGLGTYGSRSTPVSGAAVAVVSRKVRDKARLIASTMLEASPEDLAWEKGRWYVKGDPEKGAMIEEIAVRAYSGEPMPEGMEGGLDAQVIYDPPNLTYPYGAYIAVVDIDPDTAQVKVRRFIAVDDCGVRINPMVVDGQIHGGLAEGIGIALMEVLTFDEEGNCLNSSFMDYLIPTALECPDFELGETVTPCPHHPLGAKGVGESPNVGSPPAIVNAVIDALHSTHGVDHIDMPCTPARVWAAMQGRAEPPQ